MAEYSDKTWTSTDGLTLHFRDYAGRMDRPPIVCLPGLTRNARDFEHLAERLAGEWRVICADMRGRGQSDYTRDSSTYVPLQYVDDVEALLLSEGIQSFVGIGTSLGGLILMLMAYARQSAPEVCAERGCAQMMGVVINDIGPTLEPEGMERIRGHVGQGRTFPTWMHAARAMEETHGVIYPDYDLEDWLNMAKCLMKLTSTGRIEFDYDMKISEPLAQMARQGDEVASFDLWPAVDALGGRPILIFRGAHSDLFSETTLGGMMQRLQKDVEAAYVTNVGHAPTLNEPEAIVALDRFLKRIA